MNALDALPFLAVVVAGLGMAAAFATVRAGVAWRGRRNVLLRAAALLGAVTFLWIVALFLLGDLSYEYVFLYTRTDLPLRYKLAGAWAGRQGSLALWAALSAIVTAVLARRWADRERDWTIAFLALFSTAFLAAVAWQDTFARTSDFFLQQRPLGNGLNPTLQSDFFVIHPPMMFVAYALTNVPAAAALAHVVAGRSWSNIERPARLNWILYTVAMGLGGIWAYYTLGFGGYWAWDPVEVANLLPWLALTLYLHARLHHAKHGDYTTIGPLLGMLPFVLTLFSTISTRSGLWVSVHAFTDPTQTFDPDAPGRFLDILEVEPSLLFYVGLAGAAMAAFLALWCRRLAADAGVLPRASRLIAGLLWAAAAYLALAPRSAFSAGAALGDATIGSAGLGLLAITAVAVLAAATPSFWRDGQAQRMDLRGLNHAAVLILAASLLVLWLWHVAAANGWSTEFYTQRIPLVAMPAIAALAAFMLLPLGRRRAWMAGGGIVVLAATTGAARGAGMGLLVAAAVLAGASLWRVHLAAGKTAPLGPTMLALGALLDLLFWLNPPSDIFGLRLVWPAQFVFGGAALFAYHRSLRLMAGDTSRQGLTHLLVAALGGFFVAPLLAAFSWWQRTTPTGFRPARMGQIGIYAIHAAVAIALVGYASSTYLGSEEQTILEVGVPGVVAGQLVNITAVETRADGAYAERFLPVVSTAAGDLSGTLYWEPLTGSYYPLPATLREWDRDVYVAVDGICFDDRCDTSLGWVRAYEQTFQRPVGPEATEVQITMHTLPGLGLVWLALAMFGHGMMLRLAHSGEVFSPPGSRNPA